MIAVTLWNGKIVPIYHSDLGVRNGDPGARGQVFLMAVSKGSLNQQPLLVVLPSDGHRRRCDFNFGERGQRLAVLGRRFRVDFRIG
jgi:hypothetical protein